MVNDNNDKWSDNGDLPINPLPPKRKVLKDQINDQREMSMEELMNGSKHKEDSIRNMVKNTKSREEPIKNMTNTQTISNNKVRTREDSTRALSKNGKEDSTKTLSKSDSNKVPTKEIGNLKEENGKALTKEIGTQEPADPAKDLVKLTEENKELNNKLAKIKEEAKEQQYLKDLSKYIKNLDSHIGQLSSSLKTFTDAKSWEAMQRGKIDVRRYANYYDIHGTITTATASDPQDFDSAAYNVERIFESLERFSEIIYVTNDGTDNLYVIVSHGGRTRFSTEAIVYPGEVKCYFNVYEIRLRSPTAGLQYRVTEYCLANISEISSIPIEKANLHGQALPAANTNWLAADITPTNYPTTFMIEVAVSIAGNFSAVVTRAGNAQTVTFNVVPGPALVAGGVYIFNLLVHNGDSVNFIYSVTGGTIQLLRVQELDSASA